MNPKSKNYRGSNKMQVDAVVEQSSVAGQRGQVASMVTQDTVCRMCGTDVDWFCEKTVNGDIFHEYCAEMLEIDGSDEYFSAESSGDSFMQKPFGEPSHGGKGYLFAATSKDACTTQTVAST